MSAVLFVTEQGDSALPYYRRQIPGRGLRSAGWTVQEAPFLVERADHRLVGWRGMPFSYMPVPKVIVVRHLLDPRGEESDSAAMFAAAAQAGQRVFYDIDDDLWHLPADNPAQIHYSGDALRVLEENLRWCAGVLTTTETLAEEIRSHTPTPVYVCPNGIDVNDFPRPHLPHDPLRIGWPAMTRWRSRDLSMIAEPLAAFFERDGEAEFWHIGAGDLGGGAAATEILAPDVDPFDLDGVGVAVEAPARADPLEGWTAPIREVEWTSFSRYGLSLAEIDIAIVPMEDTAINASRSPSTGLALAACGIPCIASPVPAYAELERQGLCILADGPDEWGLRLEVAARRARDQAPMLQELDQRQLRARVHDLYGPHRVARYWDIAFREALEARRQPVGR